MRNDASHRGFWWSASHRREGVLLDGKLVLAAVAILFVGSGCTGDPTQTEEYAQLQSELADVESEFAASEAAAEAAADEAATEAKADLEAISAEVARLEAELIEVNASLESKAESAGRLEVVFEHLVAYDMWIDPTLIEELDALGLDVALADQVVKDHDWGDSWLSYGETQGYDVVVATRRTLDEQKLDEAWTRLLLSPVGSDEEEIAYWDYVIQLWTIAFEAFDDTTREYALAGDGL